MREKEGGEVGDEFSPALHIFVCLNLQIAQKMNLLLMLKMIILNFS
jgi:hypothetical protein